ncbi:MAG: hypothetical protein GC159_19705 [Phycisphaera sp.]|nr:hypothetical protein [Phycisphaera sp.]
MAAVVPQDARAADSPEKSAAADFGMTITWDKNILTIHGERIPGKDIPILYLEAYCRPGSTTAEWGDTVIGHTTQLVEASDDHKRIVLRCTLKDGVIVDHVITAHDDNVDFALTAHNPTDVASQAHWAQPCIRVGAFTGTGADKTDDKYAYVPKSFIFHDGKPALMPTKGWATEARYVPGQVWCPRDVPRTDVNPRPLNPNPAENALIGCVSADDQWIMAAAFEPCQELFQGVIRCLHSDFRIGGLKPGETKHIHGKLYVLPKDFDALLARYRKDFPDAK